MTTIMVDREQDIYAVRFVTGTPFELRAHRRTATFRGIDAEQSARQFISDQPDSIAQWLAVEERYEAWEEKHKCENPEWVWGPGKGKRSCCTCGGVTDILCNKSDDGDHEA